MDGIATIATLLSSRHATRQSDRSPPSHIRNTSEHSGMMAPAMEKSTAYTAGAPRAPMTSFFRQPLCDRVKCSPHFFEHCREFQGQNRLLRIDHYIDRALQSRTPEPNCFA